MPWVDLVWDLDDDPDGNVQHIAQHGVTKDEVEEVLTAPSGYDHSDSSGRPIAFGMTSTGKMLVVVYEEIEAGVVYPVTAYEVENI